MKIVTFDGKSDGDWIISLADLEKLGADYLAQNANAVVEHAEAIRADQLATLIYTSGTTGRPKGVRLLHRARVFAGEALDSQKILREAALNFLWLPMTHSFGTSLLSAQLTNSEERQAGRGGG